MPLLTQQNYNKENISIAVQCERIGESKCKD